jgi:transcriptional regulator with XRE-family HTH domain
VTLAERFAFNLKSERRRAGLSQEALAERAGIHRTEVSQLERALRLPRLDTVVKLGGALSVDAAVLLAGMSWEPGEAPSGRFVGRYAVADG